MIYHSWCGVSLRTGSMYIAAGFGLFSAVMLTLLAVRMDAVCEALALRAAELSAMHRRSKHLDPTTPASNDSFSDWNWTSSTAWDWSSPSTTLPPSTPTSLLPTTSPSPSPSPSSSPSPTPWTSFSNWTESWNWTTEYPWVPEVHPPGPSSTKPDGKMQSLHAVQGVVAAATAFYLAQVVANGLLLLGAMQENEYLVYPWIVIYSFVVVINLMVCAVVPATFFSHGFSVDGIFAVLGSILNIVITFYALGIVYSFSKQIKRIHTCIG